MTYTKERLLKEIEAARVLRRDALAGYHKAKDALANAKEELVEVVATARHNGDIEGKNEADRDAHARLMFKDHYDAVWEAEGDLNRARKELEIANNQVELCRDLIDTLTLTEDLFV